LLLFSGLAFFLLLPLMKRTETITLDVDWLWRRGLPQLSKRLSEWFKPLYELGSRASRATRQMLSQLAVDFLGQPHTADREERGLFARSWPIGTTALWIAILLSAYVLVYYI
jgi:multicomponent Na+:H+ antiporter subunit D